MTAIEYFRLFAPEFSGVDDPTVNVWLTVAGSLTVAGCLDTDREAMAQALYAAHMASMAARSGSAVGALTSEREGDLQRTYAPASGSEKYLGTTSYGQQYLDLTRACFGAAILTRN